MPVGGEAGEDAFHHLGLADNGLGNLATDGFEGDDNRVTLVSGAAITPLERMSKSAVADHVLDHFVARRSR